MRYTIISLVAGSLLVAAAAVAQPMIILYEHAGYTGESITYEGTVSDLRASRWNDKATSLRVIRGSWEICRHPGFGECELLFDGGTGELPNLNAVNWNDRISSLRAFQPPTEAQPPVSNQGTPGLQSAENFKISGRGVLATCGRTT